MTPLNRAAQALTESLNTSSINGDLATFAVIAVLKAVREPSEEMISMGCFCDDLRSDRPGGTTAQDRHWMTQSWVAMIDTIINEGGAK